MKHNLNTRQLKFCEHVLAGVKPAKAIVLAGSKSRQPAREANELLKNPNVSEYLDSKRAKLEQTGEMTRQEALRFLADVVRTPVGEIDENNPLCQEVSYSEFGKKLKMPCKLGSLKQIAAMLPQWLQPVESKLEIVITKQT